MVLHVLEPRAMQSCLIGIPSRDVRLLICFFLILPASFILWQNLLNVDAVRYPGFVKMQGRASSSPSSGKSTYKVGDGSDAKRLLYDLLAPGFEEESCLSRYRSGFFRKISSHRPSSALIKRLREYEKLHILCGPHTEIFNQTLAQLKEHQSTYSSECKYIVWTAYNGLGNRILTIASAFAYALLTNRVLLIEQDEDMTGLFCEPFPNVSWLLPPGFPVDTGKLSTSHPFRYDHIVENLIPGSPDFVYLYLSHDLDNSDMFLFCGDYQTPLLDVNWLIIKSDVYFIPSLFQIPAFEVVLENLFPDKETVFHHLGRYLFHPSNQVWRMVTRYYSAYMSETDETLGIQIRVLGPSINPMTFVLDQILSCTQKEHLLPPLADKNSVKSELKKSSKSVLVTSLYQGYYDQLKDMYWKKATITGEVISFHQPSHEQTQQFGNRMHNVKALSEIYLLSLCDNLVTTAWSTFGYVAQGLGGIRPWILLKPHGQFLQTPCRRALSMEPCFLMPLNIHCKTKLAAETSSKPSFLGTCEDLTLGTKLFGNLNS